MSDPNKGNPVSPDGAKSSLLIDQWQPHGQLFFLSQKGGLVALSFWNLDQISDASEWAGRAGLVAFKPNETIAKLLAELPKMGGVDLYSGNGGPGAKPQRCGKCGNTSGLRKDKKNRGWYCGIRIGDDYCGWQSWK